MKRILLYTSLVFSILFIAYFTVKNNVSDHAIYLKGKIANHLVKNYNVKVFKLTDDVPFLLGEGETIDSDFNVKLKGNFNENDVLLVEAFQNDRLSLVSTLQKNDLTDSVTISPITTVATSAIFAQFIDHGMIQGDSRLLDIAYSNIENIANVHTGDYGKTILNGDNLTESNTMGRYNTINNIIDAFNQNKISERKVFNLFTLKNEEPRDILDATAMMYKHSWVNKEAIFNTFSQLFPKNKEGFRTCTYLPYLEMTPNDYALIVEFNGGGIYAPGKLVIDKDNNIWSGQNWMPGSGSNTLRGIGGGVIKLSANGTPLSPAITGYKASELNGIGWGTGIDSSKVWGASINGHVYVIEKDGKVIETKINGKVGNLHGVYASPVNNDVWVCDATMNQMIRFKGGDPQKGEVIKVPGLASPFSVVVDHDNNVWVGNSAGYYVTMFNGDQPMKTINYLSGGISVRGLAIDNNDQIWVNNSFNMGVKVPQVDPSLSIMEQFTLLGRYSIKNWPYGTDKKVGSLARLDKKNPKKPSIIITNKGEITGPWGLEIDGNDQVWDANFLAGNVINIATKDFPNLNVKKGELIHKYISGNIQEVTDVQVDYVGNVWVANNWHNENTVVGLDNSEVNATRGGGKGISVIYGVATPKI